MARHNARPEPVYTLPDETEPYLTGEETGLLTSLARSCFTAASPRLPENFHRLVSCIRTIHIAGTSRSMLRQTLVVACLNPAPDPQRSPWSGSCASVRLQLSDGMLCGLRLKGNIRSFMNSPEETGALLARLVRDRITEQEISLALSALLSAPDSGDEACEVRYLPRATIVPAAPVGLSMMMKASLAALNRMRRSQGSEALSMLPPVLEEHFRNTLHDRDSKIRSYLAGLEQHALGLVLHQAKNYHRQYDDLSLYNVLTAGDEIICRNRTQAAAQLPWLPPLLSGATPAPFPPDRSADGVPSSDAEAAARVLSAVDNAMPLFEATARAFGVPCETVRRTRGRMIPVLTRSETWGIRLSLHLLAWLPPEKRPGTTEQWRSLSEVTAFLLPLTATGREDAGLAQLAVSDKRCGTIMSRWLRELAKPDLAAAAARITQMKRDGQNVEDIRDYARALLDSLHRFCRQDSDGPGEDTADPFLDTLLAWMERQPLHRLASAAHRWHKSLRDHAQATGIPAPDPAETAPGCWPPVLDGPLVIRGFVAEELTDTTQLVEEGFHMQHCVASYGPACMTGSAMIVSLRDPDGNRLSTAELQLDASVPHVTLRQHRGSGNALPPQACDSIIGSLVSLLNRPQYQKRLKTRMDFQRAARQRLKTMQSLRARGLDRFSQFAETAAWSCSFDIPPPEKPLSLSRLHEHIL